MRNVKVYIFIVFELWAINESTFNSFLVFYLKKVIEYFGFLRQRAPLVL